MRELENIPHRDPEILKKTTKPDETLELINNLSMNPSKRLDQIFTENLENSLKDLEDILLNRRMSDLSSLSAKEQFDLLKSRSLQMLPEDVLLKRLQNAKETGKPLKIKFGIDPTGSDVHLWHAISMIILNRFQRMGHHIIFIIGDFTAKIGDPTGRVESRPPLNDEQIRKNLVTYKTQVRPFFDIDKAQTLHNGEWLNKIQLEEMIGILSKIPVSAILQRDDFRTRLENGAGLSMAEIIYPIVMGMDSLYLGRDNAQFGCDIEMGGKDQFLNMQMCRRLMENDSLPVECIISTDILEGINGDGRKMGKSFNNYIGLTHSAEEIYGRIMSIPDTLMQTYYKFITEIYDDEWEFISQLMKDGKINPILVKKTLARVVVSIIHWRDAAAQEESKFSQKFSKRDYWNIENLPQEKVINTANIVDFLVEKKIISSKSEGRRLIQGGGIQIIKGETVCKLQENQKDFGSLVSEFTETFLLKIGKKYLAQIQVQN